MSTRRRIVQACLAAIPAAIVAGSPVAALAQAKLKVAAVYTVPYEQRSVMVTRSNDVRSKSYQPAGTAVPTGAWMKLLVYV